MKGPVKKVVAISALICISISQRFVLAEEVSAKNVDITVMENDWAGQQDYTNTVGTRATDGQWIKGTNGKWWYKRSDGTFPYGSWEKIAGKWYLFDSEGWMLSGWQKKNGKWYYLGGPNDGAMKSGWQKIGSTWYYLGDANDGAMKSGWQKIGGKWYYFGNADDGAMKVGWQKISNRWYFFLSDGQMNTSHLVQGTRSYWFDSSGELTISVINVPRQRQERSRWCWVASAVMVGRYGTNSSITQTQAVRHVKGAVVNEGGRDYETVAAIKYVSQGTKQPKAINVKPYSYIVNHIDQNKLLGIHMSWNRGGGHMIVGSGYSLGGGSIYCVDPWENTKNRYYNYANLVNGTTIATGSGKCTSLIVY